MFDSTISSHRPSWAKMCDGMCVAWAEAGAMAAYLRAASSASGAISGLSLQWMM
jgi:hypothetical protein